MALKRAHSRDQDPGAHGETTVVAIVGRRGSDTASTDRNEGYRGAQVRLGPPDGQGTGALLPGGCRRLRRPKRVVRSASGREARRAGVRIGAGLALTHWTTSRVHASRQSDLEYGARSGLGNPTRSRTLGEHAR